ncbi:DUF485 domain-containing protein [Streptomyces heliomycini]
MQESAEFGELRRSYRSFAFPLTIAFIVWYLLYVLLSNYAGGFMGAKLGGQHQRRPSSSASCSSSPRFLIAWWYSRHAAAELDPKGRGHQEAYGGRA